MMRVYADEREHTAFPTDQKLFSCIGAVVRREGDGEIFM
jgi:hypothetical protein